MQIEIDFEVYKELTYRRVTEDQNYNDVLRGLLSLPLKVPDEIATSALKPWISKGVVFPHGTKFRAMVKGKLREAEVVDGQFLCNGKAWDGLSPALTEIADYAMNGWRHWECLRPGDTDWVLTDKLRPKSPPSK